MLSFGTSRVSYSLPFGPFRRVPGSYSAYTFLDFQSHVPFVGYYQLPSFIWRITWPMSSFISGKACNFILPFHVIIGTKRQAFPLHLPLSPIISYKMNPSARLLLLKKLLKSEYLSP